MNQADRTAFAAAVVELINTATPRRRIDLSTPNKVKKYVTDLGDGLNDDELRTLVALLCEMSVTDERPGFEVRSDGSVAYRFRSRVIAVHRSVMLSARWHGAIRNLSPLLRSRDTIVPGLVIRYIVELQALRNIGHNAERLYCQGDHQQREVVAILQRAGAGGAVVLPLNHRAPPLDLKDAAARIGERLPPSLGLDPPLLWTGEPIGVTCPICGPTTITPG